MDPTEALMQQWRALQGAALPRWLSDLGLQGGTPGLDSAAGAYTRFAQDFARLAEHGRATTPADAERLAEELRALAERFFTAALPPGAPAAPAGAPWAEAASAWARVLGGIGRETAERFAARLGAAEPPTGLRAAFDAWIDCAEAAFQQAAHSEAFISAQARLLNDYVAARSAQQALLERGARLAGMPTRADIDALHARLKQLEAEVAALHSAAATPAPKPRRRSR